MKTFREWLLEGVSTDEWDADDDKAQHYFSIGHGDYSDEHGFEPDHFVWAYINGKVEKSRRYKTSRKTGTTDGQSHGALWGHHVTDRTFKGRYEPQTGRLSIVKPMHAQHSAIPSQVMSGLYSTFKNIKHVHEF